METSKIPADPWVYEKRDKVGEVMRACAGLWIEAIASNPYATPGGQVKVTTTLVNRSDFPLSLVDIKPAEGAASQTVAELKNDQPVTRDVTLTAPNEYSQPYWLRDEPGKGLYTVKDQRLVGWPENTPLDVFVNVSANNGGGSVSLYG